jgi:ribosomal protein S18 acetylase RimI-like enzyme
LSTGTDSTDKRGAIDALLLADAMDQLSAVPEPARSQLAAMQVVARRAGYEQAWPDAVDRGLVIDGATVGRLLVCPTTDGLHVVDVRVHPDHRGRGAGTAALADLCAEADRAGAPITLSVAAGNPAARLYARAGFVRVVSGGPGGPDGSDELDEQWRREPLTR